ncbi:MAG: hypothetical protein QM586_07265 [Xenophilus sp.]
MARWIAQALGWAALAAGWMLIWRGQGGLGAALVAVFAVIRLALAGRRWAESRAAAGQAPSQPPARLAPPVADHPRAAPAPAGHADARHDRRADTPPRWRQLAWVCYGNAFLKGHAALDDWYRHGLLSQSVALFRDAGSRELLAGDGFEWLCWLRQRGALQLSLDGTALELGAEGIGDWEAQAIVCHFPDRREWWCLGVETSLAGQEGGAMSWEQASQAYPLRMAGDWRPDLDAWWRVASEPGQAAPGPVDWIRERRTVEQALREAGFGYVPDEEAAAPYEPFFWGLAHDEPEWARFPVLPDDDALPVAHHLLRRLMHRQAWWSNEMQPKNEHGLFAMALGDARALEELDAYGALLSRLIGRVQVLAGAETRWRPRKPG